MTLQEGHWVEACAVSSAGSALSATLAGDLGEWKLVTRRRRTRLPLEGLNGAVFMPG